MRTDHLPQSGNVEDRRGERPSRAPRFTLSELVRRGLAVAFHAISRSRLAKDAGVDDIKRQAHAPKQ